MEGTQQLEAGDSSAGSSEQLSSSQSPSEGTAVSHLRCLNWTAFVLMQVRLITGAHSLPFRLFLASPETCLQFLALQHYFCSAHLSPYFRRHWPDINMEIAPPGAKQNQRWSWRKSKLNDPSGSLSDWLLALRTNHLVAGLSLFSSGGSLFLSFSPCPEKYGRRVGDLLKFRSVCLPHEAQLTCKTNFHRWNTFESE